MSDEEYEDDFEDYEDDFEDTGSSDDGQPVRAGSTSAEDLRKVMQSIQEENKQVALTSSGQSVKSSSANPSSSVLRRQHDGARAGSTTKPYPRSKALTNLKQRVRGIEEKRSLERTKWLLPRLHLIEESFDLYSDTSVSKYEQFVRRFGTGEIQNTGTQFNDENMGVECQTDTILHEEVATQAPEDLFCTAMSGRVDAADSIRMLGFVRKAVPVIESLLIERSSSHLGGLPADAEDPRTCQSTILDGARIVLTHTLTRGRPVVDIAVTPGRRCLVLYGTSHLHDSALADNALLLVWDFTMPHSPQRVLTCDGQPTCCEIAESGYIAFAGLEEGSLVVWDLREPHTLHKAISVDEGKEAATHHLRRPSYATDAIAASHSSSVVALQAMGTSQEAQNDSQRPSASGGGDIFELVAASKEKTAFQLFSLDEFGSLIVWTVLELREGDKTGSADLGLGIGAKLKIVQTACIPVLEASRALSLGIPTHDSNRFFVGTAGGDVAHGVRHGDPPDVSRFRANDNPNVIGESDACSCLALSPHSEKYLAAAMATGFVCIFHVDSSRPVAMWPVPAPVAALKWSPTRSSVLYALTSAGELLLWDLSRNNQGSYLSTSLALSDQPDTAPTLLALMNWQAADKTQRTLIATPQGDGEVHLLSVKEQYAAAQETPVDSLLEQVGAPS